MEQFTIEHNLPMIKYKVAFPYSLIEINTFYIEIYDAHFLEYSYSHNQELEKEFNQMSIPYARIKSSIKHYSSPILDKNGNVVDTSKLSYSNDGYKDVTIKAMTSALKSPSSAKFGSLSLSRNDNNAVVRGYVDADNSFGANIRTEFAVMFYEGSIRDFDIITE